MADLQELEKGTEFIRNPDGTVHDVLDVVAADREDLHQNPALALARKGEGGWHMASDEEIQKYCKTNGLEVPKKGRERKAEDEVAESKAAEPAKKS